MDRLLASDGSVTPLAVVGAGLLMCLVGTLSGVMQIVDAYDRLAAVADDEALLVAQRQLFGADPCPAGSWVRGARIDDCECDTLGSRLVLSRQVEVWSQSFRISAVGRYLIAP